MTFLEAAANVLKEYGQGGPLHTDEIAKRALEMNLIQSKGQTPEATMAAQLYVAIKRDQAAGREPRFVQVGRGLFALAVPASRGGIEAEIATYNKKTREALHEKLRKMSPTAFEHLIAQLLSEIGYEDVEVTGRTGDGGIDAIARLSADGVTDVATAIQAKRWSHNVGGSVVREMRGSLMVDQRGLIMTTAEFTKDARDEAKAPGKQPVSLVNGEKLIDLLVKHDIGVTRKGVDLLQLNLEAIEEAEEEARTHAGRGKAIVVWPLPGGKRAYFETLTRFLRQISVSKPDDEEMAAWVKAEFPQVESQGVIDGYLRVPRNFGLAQYDGENLVLTSVGIDFLSAPSKKTLLEILKIQVLGITELLAYLSERSHTKADLHKRLIGDLKLGWETDTQTGYRLTWLENLDAVVLKDGKYSLSALS